MVPPHQKTKQNKNIVIVELDPSDKTFWILARGCSPHIHTCIHVYRYMFNIFLFSPVERSRKYIHSRLLRKFECRNCINYVDPEACSTMGALGVLSSAFSLNASTHQSACKSSRFISIGVSPKSKMATMIIMGFCEGLSSQ